MTTTLNRDFKEIRSRIQSAHRILITSHVRPDGDAVGSTLAFGLALQEAGKDVQMVLADGVPRALRHLKNSEKIQKKPSGVFDLIVVVDCSGLDRVGTALDEYPKPDLNIDHHITNLNFAHINLVESTTPSTAEMLARYLPQWGLEISQIVAEALLTGIITDTLGFRTSNVQPQTLRTAAALMELDVDMPKLYTKALHERSFEAVRYWGAGLNHIEMENQIIWTTLSNADREASKYPGKDDADLVSLLASVDGAVVAVIFIEQPNGMIKVSWRARPGYDTSKIAAQFDGGGHKAASGATIEGALDDVKKQVITATQMLTQ